MHVEFNNKAFLVVRIWYILKYDLHLHFVGKHFYVDFPAINSYQ